MAGPCHAAALLALTACLAGLPLLLRRHWQLPVGADAGTADQRLIVVNGCSSQDVWIASSDNVPGARNVRIPPGGSYAYSIPLTGLESTRFWPKMKCNSMGEQCIIGSSGGPGQDCPAVGCAPPVDSKFEASWGCVGTSCTTGQDTKDWWDTSAVDGFTLPFRVQVDATCATALEPDCTTMQFAECPTAENLGAAGVKNLQVRHPDTGEVVGCYSPCGKLSFSNWGNTDGEHQPDDPLAAPYCCPTPPISADQCRTGPVVGTAFVNLIHQRCANVYGYAYDDRVGLQVCPAGTKYTWTILCPASLEQSGMVF